MFAQRQAVFLSQLEKMRKHLRVAVNVVVRVQMRRSPSHQHPEPDELFAQLRAQPLV